MAAHDLESFGLGVAVVHEMKRGNCQDIINYLCTKRGGERSQETKIEYMIEEYMIDMIKIRFLKVQGYISKL